jgi:hypothetical protein
VKFSPREVEGYKREKLSKLQSIKEMTVFHLTIKSQPLDKDKEIVRNDSFKE